jgi:D-ribose pyranase
LNKNFLLHSEISYTLSKMGHMDELTISDAGLPIPDTTQRIDLALSKGIPSFIDTLKAVLSEQKVQTVVLASEIKTSSPDMHNNILKAIHEYEKNLEILYITHEQFKERTTMSKAVIRTGEFTPYSNIILVSGVVF